MATKIIEDGIWTWFNGPEAAISNGNLFVGAWTTRARPAVVKVNLSTGDVSSRLLQPQLATENDDHDNPAVLILQNGRVFAAWSDHNGDSWCATSQTARELDFGDTISVFTGSTDAYAHLWQAPTGRIYWFFRRQVETTFRPHYMRYSDDSGATWSSPVAVVSIATQRPYFRFVANDNNPNRLDFFFNNAHPDEGVLSLYHGYMLAGADNTLTWHKTDGTLIGAVADLPFDETDFTQVYDGTSSESYISSAHTYSGVPACTFTRYPSHATGSQEYYRGTWNGSAWVTEKVSDAGTTAADDHLYAAAEHYNGQICLDPENQDVAYLGREYGATDFRMERFEKLSGTWTHTHDLSGDTSSVNARPVAVSDGNTTRVVWWEGTYTSYTNYDTSVWMWPELPMRSEKLATPTISANYLPRGSQIYLPLNEGGGTPQDAAGDYTVSIVGSPTWARGSLGPQIGSFSTSNYLTFDDAAAAYDTDVPLWMAVMFTSSSTSLSQYLASFGSSASDLPVASILINRGTAGTVSMFYRNSSDVSQIIDIAGTSCNDGNPHVLMSVQAANNLRQLYFDGTASTPGTTSFAMSAMNQATLGCLRRTTNSGGFSGSILAFAFGKGEMPPPKELYLDWINGRFSGVGMSSASLSASSSASGQALYSSIYG